MKNSLKQKIITVICILIVFIPTYIAITYLAIRSGDMEGSRYTVEITAEDGTKVSIDEGGTDDLARLVLKMNSRLEKTDSIDANTLPAKFYDIKLMDNGTVSSYRYYFNTGAGHRTLVADSNGSFYSLEYKHVKSFLSHECAYLLYENSLLPVLSIDGGDDIVPIDAQWKYRAVNGTYNSAPVELSSDGTATYAMSGITHLSFSTQPDKCTVKVFRGDDEILRADSVDEIPYELLDSSSLSFRISAEWTRLGGCRGSAEYEFSSSIAKAPEFSVLKDTILSGEFFVVVAENVSAPQKVEFSSLPKITTDPVFFADGELAYALIPIDKELSAPADYTFTFRYGESVSELSVSVEERRILTHDYNSKSISVQRSEKNIKEYEGLLSEIGNKCEQSRYFDGDKFIDYELYYGTCEILLGFGHKRVPNNGYDAEYRLDGVDYTMHDDFDVPAIAAGKVVHVGQSELLGSFVVVDHGLGLKTWYCHLGRTLANEGKIVAKGEVIGKAGRSGYTNSTGVFLITTVLDVPVSPYPIQEEGLKLN